VSSAEFGGPLPGKMGIPKLNFAELGKHTREDDSNPFGRSVNKKDGSKSARGLSRQTLDQQFETPAKVNTVARVPPLAFP